MWHRRLACAAERSSAYNTDFVRYAQASRLCHTTLGLKPLSSAAQKISLYTISLVDVRDSLDATAASNRLYNVGLLGEPGWLGACCSGEWKQFLDMTKIVIPLKIAATSCKP